MAETGLVAVAVALLDVTFVGTMDVIETDDVEVEERLVEGKDSDVLLFARLQNCCAKFSAVVNS